SIVDIPSSIESMSVLENLNILGLLRSDNTIELWNTDTWVQFAKIYGNKDLGARRIFLMPSKSSYRIFTINLNGYLIEWSLYTMSQKQYYHNPGGSLWDYDLNNKLCLLACNDGSPRVIQIKKNSLFLEKQFSKINSKILS